MPTWVIGILEWAVGLALQHVNAADVKKAIAGGVAALDAAIQAKEAGVKGPFEGVADEVALAFHEAAIAVVTALTA